jgi:hypothetical protein
MSEEIKVDKVMDLKGMPCPMPVVKVSKGIKEIQVGQVLEAVTTDPGALAVTPNAGIAGWQGSWFFFSAPGRLRTLSPCSGCGL